MYRTFYELPIDKYFKFFRDGRRIYRKIDETTYEDDRFNLFLQKDPFIRVFEPERRQRLNQKQKFDRLSAWSDD